jgi:hypothetical protein
MQNTELEKWYADLSPAATHFAYSFASDLLSKPDEEQTRWDCRERRERYMPEIKFRRIVACLVMLMAALCTSGCEREMPDCGVFRKAVVW